MRKTIMALLGALIAVAAFAQPAAGAAGGCEMQGTAQFAPGLGTTSQAFAYDFAGQLASASQVNPERRQVAR